MDKHKQVENQKKLEEVQKDLIKRAHIYKQVFSTPEGDKVLTDLVQNFNPEYICGTTGDADPTGIIVRGAQRDVIEHIHRYMRIAEKHNA